MPLLAATIGAVPSWVLVGVAVLAAWRISRGGAGGAVAELSEANRVLERRLHDLGGEVRDLKIENAELRSRTDFATVMDMHEGRAVARHERLLTVLDLIAVRLGPDNGPHGT